MKAYKKFARIFFLTLFMILASFGMVSIFPTYRDRYQNNEIKIELVEKDKKEEENDFEIKDIK